MLLSPIIRRFPESDLLTDLTTLLHNAYASLANIDLRYLATHQDEATTLLLLL